ncbi:MULTISPECIES: porin [Pseudoalteromonas]|uniref:Outer membrane protein beta-barrel domain-containing protein n=1 Tax=Pseudoalteromonas peptidolytica F12-50-A1 TaxID=1315280 RepID=A0A8I0N1Q4_9GAMM|nr:MULTISPECIES: porin [Pseudoalteromonas]MBE0349150.1 hypothetical protein [Pseudoalteromonas peptidolytica F12-50-A1]MDW7548970.1 porin [Pseudoalteromonas peptidolytica]NLR16240.1 porin family protein [Pseudoalteromonas peptidolytica]RXE99554.1 porin [Pseudoalteromonas sp. PS5]GEK11493.1 hypothetical protein PPE03_37420 [Pseudoalteromonas peptidolytica]
MNSVLKQVVAVSALLVSTASAANSTDFVELGYGKITIDNLDEVKPAGVVVTANKAFDGFYLQGSYAVLSDDISRSQLEVHHDIRINTALEVDTDLDYLTLLVGHQFDVSDAGFMDIYGGYSRYEVDVEYSGITTIVHNNGQAYQQQLSDKDSDNSDHYHLEAAYEHAFGALSARIGLGVERIQNDESETNFVYLAKLGYQFTDRISANISYRNADEYDNFGLNLRYSF